MNDKADFTQGSILKKLIAFIKETLCPYNIKNGLKYFP